LLQFIAYIAVHPLMRTVVLGFSRPPPLQINSEGHPPRRQPAQAQHCCAGRKRRAVVAADRFGKAILFKQPLENGLHGLGLCSRHAAHFQHIAAPLIAHGKRLAPFPIPGVPPALEIHGPHIVWLFRCQTAANPPGFRAPAPLALFHPAGLLEDSLEGAFRRSFSKLPRIQLADLLWPPLFVRLTQPCDLANDVLAKFLPIAVRLARSVGHAGRTLSCKTLLPLVADTPADPILPA